MECNRRLSGAGATLHHERTVEWRTDDLILFSLDGGDDVAHLTRPRPAEGSEQRTGSTNWSIALHEAVGLDLTTLVMV
jgi:hypothetical protein